MCHSFNWIESIRCYVLPSQCIWLFYSIKLILLLKSIHNSCTFSDCQLLKVDRPRPNTFIMRCWQWATEVERMFCVESDGERYCLFWFDKKKEENSRGYLFQWLNRLFPPHRHLGWHAFAVINKQKINLSWILQSLLLE